MLSQYSSQTPGAVVLVVKDGKVVHKQGYGASNLEYDQPITGQTVFHVASISKQFTAFAVYLLESQGTLALEDDIRKFLPELPQFDQPIKIKHLLFHTSGLKELFGLMTFSGWRMDDVFTNEQVLKLVSRQTKLNFAPGSEFRYTNTGYVLLSEIVARASGQSFADFLREKVFVPLGMKHTQVYDDHERVVKNRAYSYYKTDSGFKKSKLNFSITGSTNLFTTAEDLAKWADNFVHPVVGDAQLIKRFNVLATLDNGEPAYLARASKIRHAKGQFHRVYRGVESYAHTGSDAGFRAYFARFPTEKLAVIALSNDQSFQAYPTGIGIAELFLEDKMTPPVTPSAGQSNRSGEGLLLNSAPSDLLIA